MAVCVQKVDNYRWLQNADLTKYSGQWVIVAREMVVAHGHNLEELYSIVDRDYPGEERLTINVPEKGVYIL